MENNKQTSVDWFAEQIIRKYPLITQYLPNYNFDKEIMEQAREMENPQMDDWDKFANALKDEFGESLVDEEGGEEDAYNWWLTDVTVKDIVEFIKNHR